MELYLVGDFAGGHGRALAKDQPAIGQAGDDVFEYERASAGGLSGVLAPIVRNAGAIGVIRLFRFLWLRSLRRQSGADDFTPKHLCGNRPLVQQQPVQYCPFSLAQLFPGGADPRFRKELGSYPGK